MSNYVIALYIRLSLEDSKVGSMSIKNQKAALHRYAGSMEDVEGADVVEFIDNGYSGTNFERPAVQELLDRVRTEAVNCIIVKDFTRFGRNSIEVGYFMERVFPLYGVRFISVNDGFDSAELHGDTGGISVAFRYLATEFYSRDLSVKYKSAKYVKFRRGEYQSKVCPYGYRKGADGRMEPDEETAPNVRLIFELARDGHTPREIVKALFERGILTPAEYKAAHGFHGHDISRCRHIWPESSVAHILDDERYTGTYIMGKREVTEVGGHRVRMKEESQWIKIPNRHPAIVSREIFEQVRALQPHHQSPKKRAREYPLRGKVFCGCCWHAMQRTAKKQPVFLCRYTGVDEAADCHGSKICEGELETVLYDVLSRQAQIILGAADINDAGLMKAKRDQMAVSSDLVGRCQEEKRILYERFVLGEVDLDDFKEQNAALDWKFERLRQAHTALHVETGWRGRW